MLDILIWLRRLLPLQHFSVSSILVNIRELRLAFVEFCLACAT